MAELVKINGEELDEDVRNTGPKVPVRFVKSASPFTVGEIAGFNEQIAQNLEDRRVAIRLNKSEREKLEKTQQAKAQADAKAAAERALDVRAAAKVPA